MKTAREEVERRDRRNYLRIKSADETVVISVECWPIEFDRTELKKIIDTDFEEFIK